MAAALTSSFAGRRLQSTAQRPRASARRCLAAQAKYGEKNQIVDIDNLEDTTGNWELYGREDPKRYPSLQNEFFERAAGPLERREVLASLLAVGGTGSIILWGSKGAKDIGLPITVGPKGKVEKGPRGKL